MFSFQHYLKVISFGASLLALPLISPFRSDAQDLFVNVKNIQTVNGASPSVSFDVYLSGSATYVSNVAGDPNLGLQNVDVAFEVDFGTDGTAAAGTTSPILATSYSTTNLQANTNSITGTNLSGAMQPGYDSRFKFNLDRVLANTQLTATPALAGTFTINYPSGTVIGTIANGAKLSIRTTTGGTGSKWSDFLGNTGQGIGTSSTFASPTPLPVKLTGFTAYADKCDVLLNWSAVNEKDCDHFEVERSADGSQYIPLAVVGCRHIVTGSNYDYTDRAALPEGYYRLKMVAVDGNYMYSNTALVRTKCNHTGTDWNVYPNPLLQGHNVQVRLNNGSGITQVRLVITDLSGRNIIQHIYTATDGVNVYTVPVSNMAPGEYIISMYDQEGRVAGTMQQLVIR